MMTKLGEGEASSFAELCGGTTAVALPVEQEPRALLQAAALQAQGRAGP